MLAEFIRNQKRGIKMIAELVAVGTEILLGNIFLKNVPSLVFLFIMNLWLVITTTE